MRLSSHQSVLTIVETNQILTYQNNYCLMRVSLVDRSLDSNPGLVD